MTDYKLVPVEPTAEMIEAAEEACMPFGDMDLALRMAILAAPAVQGEPVAVMYEDGSLLSKADCGDNFEICCKVQTPLYTAPQPAPDVSALVEALDTLVCIVGLTAFKHEGQRAVLQDAVDLACAALATQRKGDE